MIPTTIFTIKKQMDIKKNIYIPIPKIVIPNAPPKIETKTPKKDKESINASGLENISADK